MPIYSFICSNCKNKTTDTMSISSFLKKREERNPCSICSNGEIVASLSPPVGRIEKTKEDMLREIDEEVRDIVKKVRDGDESAFDDIYGNRENPYKK